MSFCVGLQHVSWALQLGCVKEIVMEEAFQDDVLEDELAQRSKGVNVVKIQPKSEETDWFCKHIKVGACFQYDVSTEMFDDPASDVEEHHSTEHVFVGSACVPEDQHLTCAPDHKISAESAFDVEDDRSTDDPVWGSYSGAMSWLRVELCKTLDESTVDSCESGIGAILCMNPNVVDADVLESVELLLTDFSAPPELFPMFVAVLNELQN